MGYVPGYQHKTWEPGQAKLIPAGADIVLQVHYSTNGTAGDDRTRVGFVFAKEPPRERVLSVVAKSWDFVIPAGAPNHEVDSSVKFASDVRLISFHPHMHFRGKDHEIAAVYPTGESEILMRVPRWDFNWQMTYFLKNRSCCLQVRKLNASRTTTIRGTIPSIRIPRPPSRTASRLGMR